VYCVCVRVPAPTLPPRLPIAAAVKTHSLMWSSNLVVQDALGPLYYDHDVTALGVLGLQHQHHHQQQQHQHHGRSDGVCFNMLAQLVPDRVQRNRDGEAVEVPEPSEPPAVENPGRYAWHRIQSQAVMDSIQGKMRNACTLPIHSLY